MRLIIGLCIIAAVARYFGFEALVFVAMLGAGTLALAGAAVGFVIGKHSSDS